MKQCGAAVHACSTCWRWTFLCWLYQSKLTYNHLLKQCVTKLVCSMPLVILVFFFWSLLCLLWFLDEFDAYIIVSFVNATLVLSIGETVEEVTDSGFLGTTPTLSCSLLGEDALVQVRKCTSSAHHLWVFSPLCDLVHLSQTVAYFLTLWGSFVEMLEQVFSAQFRVNFRAVCLLCERDSTLSCSGAHYKFELNTFP